MNSLNWVELFFQIPYKSSLVCLLAGSFLFFILFKYSYSSHHINLYNNVFLFISCSSPSLPTIHPTLLHPLHQPVPAHSNSSTSLYIPFPNSSRFHQFFESNWCFLHYFEQLFFSNFIMAFNFIFSADKRPSYLDQIGSLNEILIGQIIWLN